VLRISHVLRNSFAVRTNFKSLFISPTRDGFKSIQGIRALNMVALLLCHMVMAKMFLPYLNKTEMSEVSIYIISWIMFLLDMFLSNIVILFLFHRICQNRGSSQEEWLIYIQILSWSLVVCWQRIH